MLNDFNYILNGTRKPVKKSNFDLFSSVKKGKDPLANLMLKPNKGSIIGDRITKPQKRILKSNNLLKQFTDWDKDGVINGLDCQPRNPKKHRANKYIRERLKNINFQMTTYPTKGELNDLNRIPPKGGEIDWADINSQKGRVIQNTVKKYPHLLSKMEKEYPKDSEDVGPEPFKPSIRISEQEGGNAKGIYESDNNEIILYRGYTEYPPLERASIMFHELRHKEQANELGNEEFGTQYYKESKEKGYRDNKFEKDARDEAQEQIEKSYPYYNTVTEKKQQEQMEMFND